MAKRQVYRIFISSTAVDLLDYRDKVRDAVLCLENLPIAMETFSARSGAPVDECTRDASDSDAVICVVAHRYGYVPPRELGGDGERSITWLEVDAARRAGKPVFAFLVDPKAPWTEVKEQDRLVSEPDKTAEIVKAVQTLWASRCTPWTASRRPSASSSAAIGLERSAKPKRTATIQSSMTSSLISAAATPS